LYEKNNFDLLEHLLDIGNDTIFLSIVTNGSVKLTEKQKSILSSFKNINFCVSIDGIGSVFEYLRYPLKWAALEKNLELFNTITENISVSYTISNTNVWYHRDTVDWFNKNNLKFINNIVYGPEYFRPSALSLPIKQRLADRLEPNDYQSFIGTHCSRDQANYVKFKLEIQKQDTLKNISIHTFLPEFADLLDL
jgi:sulfatase maturation enzyme AslB (radical SAM superfamily)